MKIVIVGDIGIHEEKAATIAGLQLLIANIEQHGIQPLSITQSHLDDCWWSLNTVHDPTEKDAVIGGVNVRIKIKPAEVIQP